MLLCRYKIINDGALQDNGALQTHNPRANGPGVSPGRGLLIPLGYLHTGKCEHNEVQSHPPLCN